MTRRWTVELGGMPPNQNGRGHYMAKAKLTKHYRLLAGQFAKQAGIPSLERVRISATFRRRALGVADQMGDVERLKALVDGIVDAKVVPNDTYRHVLLGDVTEERGTPSVVLIVEEITHGEADA